MVDGVGGFKQRSGWCIHERGSRCSSPSFQISVIHGVLGSIACENKRENAESEREREMGEGGGGGGKRRGRCDAGGGRNEPNDPPPLR